MQAFEASVPLLPEILALHGKWRRGDDALICEDQRLSWPQFVSINHQFAHSLLDQGLAPGDRLGVVMSNSAAMVHALFGAMAAGVVSVPINLSVSDQAMVGMFNDAGIKAVVVTQEQCERVANVLEQLDSPPALKILAAAQQPGWQQMEALCVDMPSHLPEIDLADDAPLNIIYSSGTTGMPKGILHHHRGRRDWAYDLAIALRYHGTARTLLTIGLYSNISWVAMLCTALAGGTLVVHSRFDAQHFLDTVKAEKITHTAMVPIQFQRVLERLRSHGGKVSSMQAMMSCGSPLHESLKREIFAQFNSGIVELYGLTEGIISTLEPEQAEGRWASVGRPLIGTDIAIVGDDDNLLPPGQAGEVVSRGRITMPGYWQRDEANAEAEYRDDQGRQWLRSGDIGYLDEAGYLYIVDRKKDMILSGGQNIYPQDIEAVLAGHAAIDDVAVIGARSSRWGETPVALVVLAQQEAAVEEILSWANQQLGKQQRLAQLIEVRELPRNPNGKILKRELRQQYAELSYD